jgi:hypothetical protein
MCELRVIRLTLSLLAAGGAARAQSATVWRDSAQRLSVHLLALRDSLLDGDSTVREVARRSGLVLGASPRMRSQGLDGLARVGEARRRWFGAALPSPNGFRIVLRSDNGRYGLPARSRQVDVVVLSGLPDSGPSRRTQRNVADGRLADQLVDLYAELMFQSGGPELRRWMDLGAPVSQPDRERRAVAMYILVTGATPAERGCLLGSLEDCAAALALRAAGPGTSGYYPPFVRVDLLLTALELGGPGAWERLRNAGGSGMEAALASAAGMPTDSLLSRWRRGLLALRPGDSPLEAEVVLVGLVWTAGLLVAALGLSRWA